MSDLRQRLPIALFALRVTVFLVLLMWTLDKFVNPDHATAVYENFYYLSGMGAGVMAAIGVAELVIILLFLAGIAKIWTYGAVLVFHAISTLSTWQQYMSPFDGPNLLFFAAWPMLAACFVLFWLREYDTMWTFGSSEQQAASSRMG